MDARMELKSGGAIDLASPDVRDIKLSDIAYGLSNIARFSGQADRGDGGEVYTVAQHSVLCSMLDVESDPLDRLMHDAAEAYMGDASTPFKNVLPGAARAEYQAIQSRLDAAIATAFDRGGVIFNNVSVKVADTIMLIVEAQQLAPFGPIWDSQRSMVSEGMWDLIVGHPDIEIWSHIRAEVEFLTRAQELGL